MKRILCALLAALTALALCACGAAQDNGGGGQASLSWEELSFEETMPLRYAEQFSVSYAGEDYKFITIGQDQEFLLVAEGADVPSGGLAPCPPTRARPRCDISTVRATISTQDRRAFR